jgi:hypothetical protein
MPYTAAGKNLMLNALKGTNPGTPITHAGLLDAAAEITAVTALNSTDVFSKTAHGLSNGDLVVLTEKTGGSGVTAGDAGNANGLAEPFYVITANANDFQLSRTSGGSAVDIGSDISAVKVIELVEISGGSPAYSREVIAFNNAVDGSMDDSTNGAVFDVPAGATVDYVGFYSASTAGTCLAVDKVTSEAFGGQGTYTLTDGDLALTG